MTADFLVVGAGIFGLTTAIELRRNGHSVKVVNPTHRSDPQAASHDISKIIRMEYGSDLLYMQAADHCIDIWHDWNIEFGRSLYHQVGFLLLCKEPMEGGNQDFEWTSYRNLIARGHKPVRISSSDISSQFPAFDPESYRDGFFHARAGYANATLTLDFLRQRAIALGIEFADGLRVASLTHNGDRVTGVNCRNGSHLKAGHIVICAGAFSVDLVPGLEKLIRPTGHPVFHITPERPKDFSAEQLPVFAADISHSGWYGFPMHPDAGVVKIANHGVGLNIKPYETYEPLEAYEMQKLSEFVDASMPSLKEAPISYTRRCFYSDTFDGHFLIDQHPEYQNLTVGTGGSGHGFKMGPLLGKWVSAAAEQRNSDVPQRFKWRNVSHTVLNQEEARNT